MWYLVGSISHLFKSGELVEKAVYVRGGWGGLQGKGNTVPSGKKNHTGVSTAGQGEAELRAPETFLGHQRLQAGCQHTNRTTRG